MALTKVQKTGITDNAIDADKIEDGTIVAADIAPGTITNAKLAGSIANDKLANSSITVNGSSVSLGGSVSAGKVQWQAVKTADFNAVAGEGYFVDTDSVGAVTATLPGSPSAGDTIAFKDYAANFGTNSLTIARNGNNIQGVANDSEISTNRASIVLVYIDATKGWLYTNESNVADLQDPPLFITATGGTVATSGDYKIHTFTGDGCFVVSCAGNPQGSTAVDYFVVAGGGAGSRTGGGGGAGGFRLSQSTYCSASPIANPAGLPVSAQTYPVSVGAGGAALNSDNIVNNPGTASIFSTITSAGGGGGSSYSNGPGPGIGANGGSGGGGGTADGTIPGGGLGGGTGNTPPVSPPQGQPGGTGTPTRGGGGGGGAAAVGGNAPGTNTGGTGGDGTFIPTSALGPAAPGVGETGPAGRYLAGGGGGTQPSGTVAGGLGGGGDGGPNPATPAKAGVANTGGGGGGTNDSGSGTGGGSGIVIIRYKFQ